MILPHNAQCPSVRGMRSLTTTNLVRCGNPLLAKVRLGFISSSVGSQSKISCPVRNAESSPAHARYFSRGDSSDRAGARAIPPNTRTISNTNSKKCMIALRCLLDESDQCVSSAAEYPGNECSKIRHNQDCSAERSIPRECVTAITDLRFMPSNAG